MKDQDLRTYIQENPLTWNLARYLEEHTFKDPFLKAIPHAAKHSFSGGQGLYTLETLAIEPIQEGLSTLRESLRVQLETAYAEQDETAYTLWQSALISDNLPVWGYPYLSPQGKAFPFSLADWLGCLSSVESELTRQRAWSEWREGATQKESERGILTLTKAQGLHLKSPEWHYEKALEALIKALNRPNELTLLASPHTYHHLIKRKLGEKQSLGMAPDSWEWQGLSIPILTIAELPNDYLLLTSPTAFERETREPLTLREKGDNSLWFKGTFEIRLKEKHMAGTIELLSRKKL